MPRTQPLSLAELAAMVPRLQATIDALRHLSAPASRTSKRSPALSPRSRAGGAAVRDRILTFLARTSEAPISAIAADVKASLETVRYQLKSLRASRKVKMTGTRATARWSSGRVSPL
jgi:hypothetical protein